MFYILTENSETPMNPPLSFNKIAMQMKLMMCVIRRPGMGVVWIKRKARLSCIATFLSFWYYD